jgi:serine protease Do
MPAVGLRIACTLSIICSITLAAPSLAQMPSFTGGKMPTLAPLVREITPSVVNIAIQGREEIEYDLQAIGSGVIVDAQNGYVLTANHVIAQVPTVQVTTKDGRRFSAKLVGRDPGTDVAVLRLQGAHPLKAIPLGDSDSLEVGDFVIAVENPFGLGQTVTSGLVSALGRSGLGTRYEDFIQTDAPINPGNSGGALVNLRGELVGINTAIFSAGGGNVGIGFAVPINMARWVMEQIVEHGHVRRGQIGVSIKDLTPAIGATPAGAQEGAVIAGVVRGSSAEQGGLQKGDIVVAADGAPVRSAAGLRNKLGITPVGKHVQLTVKRKGVTQNVEVEMAPAGETTGTISVRPQPQPRAAWHPRR